MISYKNVLRESYKKTRDSVEGKKEKSLAVCKALCEDPDYQKAQAVAMFKSFGTEIDTSYFISAAVESGKTVLLPRVCGADMMFYKYLPGDTLEPSRFGIEEPLENDRRFVSVNDIDLIIVPGLCFDKGKNRLGYGGGFYDRVLSGGAKNIAVCFDEQVLENGVLPVCPTDVKVQKIITDKRTIK